MKYFFYNIILGYIFNWLIAPISLLFIVRCQRKKGFFWWFLSDGNMYGDVNWRKNLKGRFLRMYLWMLRNPLQNHYWKDFVEGKSSNYKGYGKIKFNKDVTSWRTMRGVKTKDNHGKICDFVNSPLGKQDITFTWTDVNGNTKELFRKSSCVPHKILFWIIMSKRRKGYEHGLKQYSFSFPCYLYSKNKEGWKLWKDTKWETIKIK